MPAATRQHPRGNGRRGLRPATDGVVRGSHLMGRLPEVVAAVIGGSLLGFGLVLVARRLTGGFDAADAGTAWLVAGVGIALVVAVDVAAVVTGGVGPWLARCGVACGVAAVAVPDRLGTGWLSLAAVAIAALPLVFGPRARGWRHPASLPAVPVPRPRASRRRPRPAVPDSGDESHDRRRPRLPGRLVQRQERYELPSGTDCLRGRVLLAVTAGGKTAHAHVGFCPAFTRTPNVRVETDYDGVEAVVSAAEVLPWGVRVECRLAEPADEPLEIPVDVFVQGSE